VPKGTAAGTTLHVSVPDEPGRILAAKVPPGNVREFHVSYQARAPKTAKAEEVPAKSTQNEQDEKQTGSMSVAQIREKFQQPTASVALQPQYYDQKQQQQQYQYQQQRHQEQLMQHHMQYDSPAFATANNNNSNAFVHQQEGYAQGDDHGQRQQYQPQPFGSPVYQARNRHPQQMFQHLEHQPVSHLASHQGYAYQTSPSQRMQQQTIADEYIPPANSTGGGGWGNFMLPFFGGPAQLATATATNN
jgi:hypothetical protein